MFRPYRVSIFVAACVGLGFWTAYIDGAGVEAVLDGALILAFVMVIFFATGTLWQSSRQNRTNDTKDR